MSRRCALLAHISAWLAAAAADDGVKRGWYGDIDPPMTFDWTADAANGWTIPIGADVGKAFSLGLHAMGIQLGAYDLLKRPDGTPQ